MTTVTTAPRQTAEPMNPAPPVTRKRRPYSTVTDLARLRGWSTSVPRSTAVW